MTYHMSFVGSYGFANLQCLEAGLDAFVAYDNADEQSGVELDDLKIDGLKVTVFFDNNAPASMSYGTQSALSLLAAYAKTGTVRSKYEGESTGSIRSGQRRHAYGLPPQHHRWEVYFAAKAGSAAELLRLRTAGVSINLQFAHTSSLLLAAQSGSAETVRVLLDAGAAVDGRGADHHLTPLMGAANPAVAEMLLAAGASQDALAYDRRPIEHACQDGAFDVAALLLSAGSSLPSDADALESLIRSIVRGGGLALLTAIVDRVPSTESTLRHPEVMGAAVRAGNAVVVDFLLQHGAVLPESYLADTVKAGAIELLRAALRGPELCGDSSRRKDLMCLAAADGHLEIMKLLRRLGVPVSPATPGETTPLHRAAAGYRADAVETVRWLLDEGAPVDALTIEGVTALGYAAGMAEGRSIPLLVERGANPKRVLDREAVTFLKKALRKKVKKAG